MIRILIPALAFLFWVPAANAWSFIGCFGPPPTLRSEMSGARSVALLEPLPMQLVPPPADAKNSESGGNDSLQWEFRIATVLKTAHGVAPGQTVKLFVAADRARQMPSKFLALQYFDEESQTAYWIISTGVTHAAAQYVERLAQQQNEHQLPAFYFQHFNSKDALVRKDAEEELLRFSHQELSSLKPLIDHEQLVHIVKNGTCEHPRLRLALELLTVVGDQRDAVWLAEILRPPGGFKQRCLDAVVYCYLALAGERGLPLVEEAFLKDEKCGYAGTYAAILAIRAHGDSQQFISRQRATQSLRWMLDRDELADLVISDLTRWQDWSVMPRVNELLRALNEDTEYVRVPAMRYLMACPQHEAKQALADLKKLDPEAFEKAAATIRLLGPSPPGR